MAVPFRFALTASAFVLALALAGGAGAGKGGPSPGVELAGRGIATADGALRYVANAKDGSRP